MNEPRPPIIPNFSNQPPSGTPIAAAEINNAPPLFKNGMLMANPVLTTTANEVVNSIQDNKEQVTEITNEQNKKIASKPEIKVKKETVLNSTIVVFVVATVALVGLGIAYFLTWQKQRTEIAASTAAINQKNQQIANLNNLLTQANDLRLTQQKLPVYVDSNGHFSFLQEIPGLTVTKDDTTGKVNLYYGQADADMLLSGFAMTIEEKETENDSIDKIAEKAWMTATGNTTFDAAMAKSKNGWRDESPILSDIVGYSFVATVDGKEQYFYFLQKGYLDSKNYLAINFTIAATTRSEYDGYEGVATKQVLESLEIY